jgi:hypothetical protein
MLETLKGLLTMVEAIDVRVSAKNVMVVEAWKNTIPKAEVWKWQKFVFCEQVHSMKYGSKHLSLHPLPLPFISMDNDASKISLNHMLILPCPFCLRGFDHAWDCKLVSCKHAYH